jgi:hypothetical protein
MPQTKIIVLSFKDLLCLLRLIRISGDLNSKEGVNMNGLMVTQVSSLLILIMSLTACGPSPSLEGAVTSSQSDYGIIGGEEVATIDPVQSGIVALYDLKTQGLCTGSILSDNLILTAAHCIGKDVKQLKIIFANKLTDKTRIIKSVRAVSVSPYWDKRQRMPKDTGDIALVRFDGGLPTGYKPARLLTAVFAFNPGQEVLLAGYGISNGNTGEGSATLRKVKVTIDDPKFANTEIRLDQRNGRGACHGDSGGPAYVTYGGVTYLWGITSRGDQDIQDNCSQFSVYTNALAYRGWLQKESQRLNALPAIKSPSGNLASNK